MMILSNPHLPVKMSTFEVEFPGGLEILMRLPETVEAQGEGSVREWSALFSQVQGQMISHRLGSSIATVISIPEEALSRLCSRLGGMSSVGYISSLVCYTYVLPEEGRVLSSRSLVH